MVCRGCKRFNHEVRDWNGYDAPSKWAVEKRLSGYLEQVSAEIVEICDEDLLRRRLRATGVNHPAHRSALCLVWDMLRAGGADIDDTERFGFRVKADYQAMPLAELCETISLRCYKLGSLYYQRQFVDLSRRLTP